MNKIPKPLRNSVLVAVVVGVLHFGLLKWLAATNVVSTLLSRGEYAPLGSIALALLFVVVRVFAVLVIPASFLSQLAKFLVERFAMRTQSPSTLHDISPSPMPKKSR